MTVVQILTKAKLIFYLGRDVCLYTVCKLEDTQMKSYSFISLN